MYLNYFSSIEQVLVGQVVSVVYWTISVQDQIFLSNWRDLYFHEHFHLEISSKCDIKAVNSSILCKFHEGRKELRPMGSNADSSLRDHTTIWTPSTGQQFPVARTFDVAYLKECTISTFIHVTQPSSSLSININEVSILVYLNKINLYFTHTIFFKD